MTTQPPTKTELEEMALTLRSNGYEVTKQRDLGAEYIEGLLEFAKSFETTTDAGALPSRGAHHLVEWLDRAAEQAGRNKLSDVEVYVEIDRSLLVDAMDKAARTGQFGPGAGVPGEVLWTHLWPVVVRIDDQNDVILHVTSGDRALSGRGGPRE